MKTSTLLALAAVGVGAYMVYNKSSTGGDGSILSSPSLPYGISESNTPKENLEAANKYRQDYIPPVDTSYQYNPAVVANMKAKAASSGRAQITQTDAGKTLTVGPTGNIYVTDPVTFKGTYTPGPNTKVLGAALISDVNPALVARQAVIKANIQQALTGTKGTSKWMPSTVTITDKRVMASSKSKAKTSATGGKTGKLKYHS